MSGQPVQLYSSSRRRVAAPVRVKSNTLYSFSGKGWVKMQLGRVVMQGLLVEPLSRTSRAQPNCNHSTTPYRSLQQESESPRRPTTAVFPHNGNAVASHLSHDGSRKGIN